MKDEMKSIVIEEYVGLKSKMYTHRINDSKNPEKKV
jgi:hypothetical protein